jgi:energy-coupling factor transport system permease protein
VTYRRRASPLHAARAGVGSLYCLALAAAALAFEHPVLLGALVVALLGAAAGALVWREVSRALLWGLPFSLLIAVVNALVVRDGLTVIFRGPVVPGMGALDVTLEATAYGGILGLRAMIVIGCFALLSAAVDPDELLRAFRRVSFRSALTAALATRMVPVLARDARRLHDAQRCRPQGPGSRFAVVRAVAAGALDRAVDVAATLEVRGYRLARRLARSRRPWSRHDVGFAASATALLVLVFAALVSGGDGFEARPRLEAPLSGTVLLLALALPACALAPFLERRGVKR